MQTLIQAQSTVTIIFRGKREPVPSHLNDEDAITGWLGSDDWDYALPD